MKTLLLTLCLASAALGMSLKAGDIPAIPEGGKLWAVLAAGSDGWYNYRHQADVCHAYQVLREHGVPEENIIVFMEDDIAGDSYNPTRGVIWNHPNGPDVYHGVPKDYTGREVNSVNFLKVLQGEDMTVGSGKTVKSGPNDHIFVFYSDHGAPGLVSFVHDTLYADDLNAAIKNMHSNNKYSKMVFYIEACEAGSMFEGLLPENINVYATTATDALVSSYACYYDSARGTYLGDEYSVAWMEYSDVEDLTDRDLDHQFGVVKANTPNSPVCRYGDLSYTDMKVIEFQGNANQKSRKHAATKASRADRVLSYEVPRAILEKRIEAATTRKAKLEAIAELDSLLSKRRVMVDVTKAIVNAVTKNEKATDAVMASKFQLKNFGCYYPAVKAYNSKCFDLACNDYSLRQLQSFVNLCETGYKSSDIIAAIETTCAGRTNVCGTY